MQVYPLLQQRGFSLIEAAIVLGIVGLVIGGLWAAASSVTESRRNNRTLEQIAHVTQVSRHKIKHTLRTSDYISFWNGTCPPDEQCITRANWSAYLPPDMTGTHDAPLNPYGHPTEVRISAGELAYSISLGSNVKACAKLGPRIVAMARVEKDPYGGNVGVWTAYGWFDVSSPIDSGSLCQTEYDNVGELVLNFSIRH